MKLQDRYENFTNYITYAMFTGGLIFLTAPKNIWPEFYSPTFFGINALISTIIILAPKYILRTKDEEKQNAVILLRLALASAIALNALGEVYLYQLYKYGFQYDKLLHLVSPFFLVVVISSFSSSWMHYSSKKSNIASVLIVSAGIVLWEFSEFFSDIFFKTAEFGVYGQYKVSDTIFDVIFGFLGIFLAAIYLNSAKYNKSSVNKDCPEIISSETSED